MRMVVTLTLIPTFSPEEKENICRRANKWTLKIAARGSNRQRLAIPVPSPRGEGQGEGGR
jgi:hypothetical protein